MTIRETREYKEKHKAQSASEQKAAKEKLSEIYELRKMSSSDLALQVHPIYANKKKSMM